MDVAREAKGHWEAATRRAALSPVPTRRGDLAGEDRVVAGSNRLLLLGAGTGGRCVPTQRPCSLHCPIPAGSAT